ncbi:amino acid adenylation domain-containing protein, partial [Dokdonia sp.]|uniref:amino acid adenylation domain-containing protein n=1 Tax=Dokdonia sp. TaxID=2024995 RepID=UPI00326350B2
MDLFDSTAVVHVNTIALLDGEVEVSYGTLLKHSNRVACYLLENGIGKGDIVGVVADRSVEMVIWLYGILKAGAAYLPINPSLPEKQVRFQLRDSGASLLVGDEMYLGSYGDILKELSIDGRPYSGFSGDAPNTTVSIDDPMYVIYTSGSTGHPKGVVVAHRSVTNLLYALNELYPFGEGNVFLFKTPYHFDVSISELFGFFLNGPGTLAILGQDDEKDPYKILDTIGRYGVTHINFVPSLFNAFVDIVNSGEGSLAGVEHILLAGEALSSELVRRFRSLKVDASLHNIYGPTEYTVYATHYLLDNWTEGVVPIGRPIQNTAIRILDSNGNLQPIGVAGELCISGAGVALGYLNNVTLTASSFVNDPYDPERLMYRTGDLACWLSGGDIEFLGRIDHQVKIRGNRIELGEIERALDCFEGIGESVVVAKIGDDDTKYLSAYFTATRTIKGEQIRDFLLEELPSYMVPSYFTELSEFPLTSSGKKNISALPEPTFKDVDRYVAPSTPIEEIMCSVWASVLGNEKIGVEDNFFIIGGDSIKAIQIMSRLRREGYKVAMRDIFAHPTVRGLSLCAKGTDQVLDQSTIVGELSLTPIQHHFFDLYGDHSGKGHYNQNVLLYNADGLDPKAIRMVLGKLQKHHDALRITFSIKGEKIVQNNNDEDHPLSFTLYDLKESENGVQEMERAIEGHQVGLDIVKGPLMRAALFQLNDGDRLFITVHHLVIDGVSWRILFEDLQQLYEQHMTGGEVLLPLKTTSYMAWATKLEEYAKSEIFLKELPYWKDIDAQVFEPLPKDKKGVNTLLVDSGAEILELDAELTDTLLTKAHLAFGTEINDLLLSGLALAVQDQFHRDGFMILLEGHGREQIIEDIDISRTVGWFTTMYPVQLESLAGMGLHEHIKGTKERLRKIPNKGIGYGIYKYLSERFENSSAPKPEILFNYLGQFASDIGTGDFVLAAESAGTARDPNMKMEHSIALEALVERDRLKITCLYNSTQYHQKTIQEFLEHYLLRLKEIATTCLAVKTREYTPSDY